MSMSEAEPIPVRRYKNYQGGLKVVFDPLGEDGGYKPGFHQSDTDLVNMLQNMSYSEGTILRDPRGKLHVFIAAELDGGSDG